MKPFMKIKKSKPIILSFMLDYLTEHCWRNPKKSGRKIFTIYNNLKNSCMIDQVLTPTLKNMAPSPFENNGLR